MNDKAQIEEMYREYWWCMIRKDAAGLRSLMAPGYTLRHMTGVTQSADVFLSGLLNGTFNYFSAEHDGIAVTVTGDSAVPVGKSRVLAAVFGGAKRLWRLRGDFTLRKENGAWRFTGSEASTY